jgi:hypothetical protein
MQSQICRDICVHKVIAYNHNMGTAFHEIIFDCTLSIACSSAALRWTMYVLW